MVPPPLRQLVLLGLAGLGGSGVVAAGSDGLTCVGKADDQATYNAPSGAAFQILCGLDYGGGDMAAIQTDTFTACIDACDAAPGCIDVSYAGTSCYLKSNKLDAEPSQRDWVWTAKKQTTTTTPSPDNAPTCVDKASDKSTYTTASGAAFQILCGVDYSGDDMAATNTPTFAGCMDACAAAPGCVDVSYVGEACYMKKNLREANDRDHVWTAKLIEVADNKLSCIDGLSNAKVITAASGDSFEITCGKDYAGGDLLGLSAASFEECIATCDSNPDCVNVAFIAPSCYLKREQKEAVDNPAVWGAVRKVKPAPVSSTPSTPTTPATPTGPAVVTPLNCGDGKVSDGLKYTSARGGLYQIICGADYGGNDLTATAAATFEECIAACDDKTECVDVSYVAPSCYLKKALGDLNPVGHVWTAKQLRSPRDVFAFPTARPMDVGSGTETFFFEDGPIQLEPAPIATLAPVPPPGVNLAGTGVLTPDPVAELWYNGTQSDSDGADLGPVTVRVNVTYIYPSIVLDHSIFIKDVVCESGTLHGRFNISYPYYFAESTWPADDDVILITSAASCGASDDQTAFFLAHTLSFQDETLSFEALGQIVELADVFADLTIDFGNITVSTPEEGSEGEDSCGSPSADTLRGLPAVACGTNFDQALDDRLGYYSTGGADTETVLALASPTAAHEGTIEARGFFSSLIKAVVSVVKVVVQVVTTVVKAVAAVVVKAVEFVVNTAVAVAKVTVALAVNAVKLVAFAVTGQYENSLTLPISLVAPSAVQVDSPWGKAFRIYSYEMGADDGEVYSTTKSVLDNLVGEFVGSPNPVPGVEMFCVNCGVKGSVKATGRINATPLSGIKEASIGISGDMYVGLYLGVNAFAKWEKEWEKEIFEKGLPGWSIPGIVTLGPKITLKAKAMVGVQAEGQILTGASLTWPGFQATLDIAHPGKSSQGGWKPNVDRTFQVHGGVTATAAIGLPVELWFGIDILNGLFKEGAALVDFPALTGKAEFEINAGTDETSVGTDDCLGIAWEISLTNEVSLEIDDGPEFTLAEWASPALAEGCIGWTPGSGTGGGGGGPGPGVPELPGGDDDGLVKCPEYNNQVYTDDKGNQWQIKCNSDYMDYDTLRVKMDTMDACMAWCASQSNCAGVSWDPRQPPELNVNCWARSRAGPARNGVYHSMMLMSPFEIISVVFGTAEITTFAVQNWQLGNRLEINTNTNSIYQSITRAQDPIYGLDKSIFMLYRYGAETRSWVGKENSGTITIRPGPISAAPSSSALIPSYSRPADVTWIQIVEICYGLSQIRSQNVWNQLYLDSKNRAQTGIENALFGDPWVGQTKSMVVWYRDTRSSPDGPLFMATGLEHQFFKLMRNDGSFAKRYLALPPRAANSTGPLSNSTAPFSNSTAPNSNSTVSQPPTSTNTNTTTLPEAAQTAGEAEPEPGYGIATVRDTTGALQLHPAKNGNLFLSATSATDDLSVLTDSVTLSAVTFDNGVGNTDAPAYLVNGDSAGRLLHYFPDEAAELGASRLRLATWDKLPLGSQLVDLVPFAAGTDQEMLVALAATGEFLFPVMCAIEGQLNKVFLVKDAADGAAISAALEADDAKFVVTGGQASQCGPLALVASVVETGMPEDDGEGVPGLPVVPERR